MMGKQLAEQNQSTYERIATLSRTVASVERQNDEILKHFTQVRRRFVSFRFVRSGLYLLPRTCSFRLVTDRSKGKTPFSSSTNGKQSVAALREVDNDSSLAALQDELVKVVGPTLASTS